MTGSISGTTRLRIAEYGYGVRCGRVTAVKDVGVPETKPSKFKFGRLEVAMLAGIVALLAIGTLQKQDAAVPPSQPAPTVTDSISDFRRVQLAEQRVRAMLKDPDSASFRSAKVSRTAGTPIVCGEVNSKNAFGGFAGPQRFVSGTVTALEEQMPAGEMDKLWQRVC